MSRPPGYSRDPRTARTSGSGRGQNVEIKRFNDLVSECFVESLFYPLDYVRVLMQLGYEPFPRKMAHTIICGHPIEIRANGCQYLDCIFSQDGFCGLYKGLSARLLGIITVNQVLTRIMNACGLENMVSDVWASPAIVTDAEPKSEDYFNLTFRGLVINAATILVTHPFRVISTRMMASFIGKDSHYFEINCAYESILREHGALGFYRGIAPRLLAELIPVVFSGFLAFYINKYIVKSKKYRYFTMPALSIIAGTLTYPLSLVSVIMSVSGSSLSVAQLPKMINYKSWLHCWVELIDANEDRRGESFIHVPL